MKQGGLIRGFVERITGYEQLQKLLRSDCVHEGFERDMKDTWLSGVVPSKFPRLDSMRDSLEKRAGEDFSRQLDIACLKQPYGFCSSDLFATDNVNSASSRIKRDCTLYFKDGYLLEGEHGLTFASKGVFVVGRFNKNKEILVAADLHNMVAERINHIYRVFLSEYETQALPDVVKAWASKELKSTRARIFDGEEIPHQAAYLRGLEYMAETGRLVKTYTLNGSKATMPKLEPS